MDILDPACIFCKIIQKEIPADIVFEDEKVIAFKDIKPVDTVHLLLIPKKHISTVKDVTSEDEHFLGHLLVTAKKIADKYKLDGYKLQFNVGKSGGQIIFHIHLHLIGHEME